MATQSRVVTDAAAYQDLFARLDQALKTPSAGAQPRKTQLPRPRFITGYIRSARPRQTSSTRPAHAPASCLVLYGSYSRFNPLLAGSRARACSATAAQADDRPELRIGVVSSVTGGARPSPPARWPPST